MDKIILGNIITLDDKNTIAEAVVVRDDKIAFVGSVDDAKSFADLDAEVLDYGKNSVYPGFLESHTHGSLAGLRRAGQADLSSITPTDYDKYREVIKKFIDKNPGKEVYVAAGWEENEVEVTKSYLDEICDEKPLVMNTGGGHACLLNTKALEWRGIDAEYAKKAGYDLVHVDDNGEPNGYICEMPAISLLGDLPITEQEEKEYILNWQDYITSKGYTAVADAGVELLKDNMSIIYSELEKEGKLKLRTFGYLMVGDNEPDAEDAIRHIQDEKSKYSGEYYQIIGVKTFLDGVTEAHTGWQIADYADQPGYHGLERFNDKEKMTNLIVEASKYGMPVHVHSEGDGATHFMLDCIEDAEKITGNMDQRNVLAHLHFVTPKDIKRMATTKSVAAVAPLWTGKFAGEYDNEVVYVGKEKADNAFPIKSFTDLGTTIVYHSDYPISPIVEIGRSIYMGELRAFPEEELGGISSQRNVSEAVTREQSLRAMTTNVAYAWRQEDRMGSIEVGKLANFAVFDIDFLHDDINQVVKSEAIATIIDGKVVYSKN